MKRIAIIAAAVALLASSATIALADDADNATEVEAETGELMDHTEDAFEKDLWQVQLLARYRVNDDAAYDADPGPADDGILELRTGDPVIGWGAMFKLLQLERAGIPIDDLVSSEEGWAFGKWFKIVKESPEMSALLDDSPKNLGQLKKQDREENGTHGKKPKKP